MRPEVSVVAATYNRVDQLRQLIEALRAQTLDSERFEVIVVDDCSSDGTAALLERESASGKLDLRPLLLPVNEGRAAARQRGWQAARAPLVAFTDDDCVPDPGWLSAGLAASASYPGGIVQGRTEPIPEQLESSSGASRAFTRTIRVGALDPGFATCNIFYPRELLERVGGFDVDRYGRVHGGEDADLAWRAIGAGARAAFAPDAVVRHAVNWLGPIGKLRFAATWEHRAVADHPGLRRAHFTHRVFWKRSHYLLLKALVGVALPRRLRFLAPWLVAPYARELLARGRVDGGGAAMAPYWVVLDLIEMVTVARAAIRYRTPML